MGFVKPKADFLRACGYPPDPDPQDPEELGDPVRREQTWLEQERAINRARARSANIDPLYLDGFDSYNPRLSIEHGALKAAADEWLRDWTDRRIPSKGLFLSGCTGCGKTMLAAGIAVEVVRRGYRVNWWNMAEMCSAIRGTFNCGNEMDLLNDIAGEEIDLLVIDDLGVEKPAYWVLERLYVVFDKRIRVNKPVVITSNLAGKALREYWSSVDGCADIAQRIISRLAAMVEPLGQFPSKDFRRA